MPWHGVSPMDLRWQFVRAVAAGRLSMTELCDQYGISRKTGYKWVARYEGEGRAGLPDRSRRPQHSPTATDPTVVEALCEMRRRHPTWSARKVIGVLRREQPHRRWPARSTGCALLKAAGLIRDHRQRRDRGHAGPSPLLPAGVPNDLWTTDFKGEFR